jgi:hypothetical protein
MTPKEKAFFLLSEMNNAPVTLESFKKASYYGQQELKRKCLIVVNEILKVTEKEIIHCSDTTFFYWQQVKTEIENL